MNEIWRDIKGYEGMYMVSNHGRVRSIDRISCGARFKGRVLKQTVIGRGYKTGDGYLRVSLHYGKRLKGFLVHRLVAEAFIDNTDNKPFVNHKDGNKKNNSAGNLEWCTAKENTRHANKNNLINHRTEKNIAQAKINVQKCYMDRIRPVIQKDREGNTIAEYRSLAEAGRMTGINRRTIGECARGHFRTAGGYKWEYKKIGDI